MLHVNCALDAARRPTLASRRNASRRNQKNDACAEPSGMINLLGQLLINGLANGAVYALMALGFAIIYNTTHVFHFAHGAVFAIAAYAFYVCLILLDLGLIAAIVVTIIAAICAGGLIEILLYARLRKTGAGHNALMICSLGLLVLVQSVMAILFSTDVRTVRTGSLSVFDLGPLTITSLTITIGVTAFVIFVLLQAFLVYTKYGRAVRAISDNPDFARVIGIEPRRIYILVMALGSALAAVAAILISFDIGARPDMGFSIVFISALAVIIGGVGYLPGALVGSFAVGIVQQFAIWQIDSRWQNGIVYAVVLVYLYLRPQGVFGARLVVRRA
jgi:branched-chain amino acid transport system permease protein